MSRTNKIIYWVSTLWMALGMVSTGAVQLLKLAGDGPGSLTSMTHLGYPVYLVPLLGAWKMLGVVALLVPGFPLLKEWAYAGFFFIMTGALFSHIAVGDPVSQMLPAVLLLVLNTLSWYFRPLSRRLASVAPINQSLNPQIAK